MSSIKLIASSKVYILSHYSQTGGPELLHQLCDVLRGRGVDAYIVYVSDKRQFIRAEIIPAYKKYDVRISYAIDDKESNVIVFPEIYFPLSKRYKNVQKLFWWLSVDNYFYSRSTFSIPYLNFVGLSRYIRDFKRKCFFCIKNSLSFTKETMSLKEIRNSKALNACQSFYAKVFLTKHGIRNTVMLRDYINSEFETNVNEISRKDKILYNPKKGYAFTKKIIDKMPNIEFVKLTGLSRSNLVSIMRESKLYIDFGNHPGQDRLPRESAINGCCIITGKKGSANFYEDVPIPEDYKFDEKFVDVNVIVKKIKDILANYNKRNSDFDFYRESIRREKKIFLSQVDSLFGLTKS
jgi:hypothetical protein